MKAPIKAIVGVLLSVGDLITEQDQICAVLNSISEEYHPFVMKVYGRLELPTSLGKSFPFSMSHLI